MFQDGLMFGIITTCMRVATGGVDLHGCLYCTVLPRGSHSVKEDIKTDKGNRCQLTTDHTLTDKIAVNRFLAPMATRRAYRKTTKEQYFSSMLVHQ